MKKKVRQEVFNKYEGRCAYCGDKLGKGWHVDHIEPIVRDWVKGGCEKPNEDISNLNPSCPSCNIQKNSYTLEQFRENIKAFVLSLNKYNTQYKFAKKYGLVIEVNLDVVFYFEMVEKIMKDMNKVRHFNE